VAQKKMVYVFGCDISQVEKEFNRLHNRLDRIGKKAESAGKFFSAALTGPLVGLGAIASKSASDVESAYKTIQAGTGATGKALEGLKKDFEAVGKGSDQNLGEVARALAELNTRTGATGKALQALTSAALDASDLLGEDTTKAISAATRAMGDWGISADQGSETLDKLFVAAQQTGIGIGKLGEQLVQYGAPLRQMGFDFDTAAAMISKFEREGVNTELVLGSLRIALAKMAKAGVTDTAEGLQIIIEKIKNAGSAGEANAIAIEKFGSRAGPDMAAAIREGRFEIGNLVSALGTAKGAIARADEETKTFADRWQETKNRIALSIAPLGKILLDLGSRYLSPLTRRVEEFAGWWEALSPATQDLIVKMGLCAAAIGPVSYAIGGTVRNVADLVKGFGSLVALAGNVKGFLSGVSAEMWALYGAIGATIGAMATLYANLDKTPAGVETLSERRGLGLNTSGLSKQIAEHRSSASVASGGTASRPSAGAVALSAPVKPGVVSAAGTGAVAAKRALEELDRTSERVHESIRSDWMNTTQTELAQLDEWYQEQAAALEEVKKTSSTYAEDRAMLDETYAARKKALLEQEAADSEAALQRELEAAMEVAEKVHQADVKRLDQKMSLLEAQALKERALNEQLASARADADLAAYGQMLNEENSMFLADLEARRETIDAYYQLQMDAHRSLLSAMTEATMAFHNGFASALGDIVTGASSAGEAFASLGKQIVRIFVEWMARKVTASALGKSLLAAETAASVAAAATTAAAWASAAAMVSLASFGANAGPAMSGISATVALAQALAIPQLAEGGIVSRPTVAMIGEGRDREMVLPLNRSTLRSLGVGGGQVTVTQNVYGGINTKVDLEDLYADLGSGLKAAMRRV
jgi:TP901 family phage tail tape measure protein